MQRWLLLSLSFAVAAAVLPIIGGAIIIYHINTSQQRSLLFLCHLLHLLHPHHQRPYLITPCGAQIAATEWNNMLTSFVANCNKSPQYAGIFGRPPKQRPPLSLPPSVHVYVSVCCLAPAGGNSTMKNSGGREIGWVAVRSFFIYKFSRACVFFLLACSSPYPYPPCIWGSAFRPLWFHQHHSTRQRNALI